MAAFSGCSTEIYLPGNDQFTPAPLSPYVRQAYGSACPKHSPPLPLPLPTPVTLSKTKRKDREHTEGLVDAVREAVDEYPSVYVFEFSNMRNSSFKELREELKPTCR